MVCGALFVIGSSMPEKLTLSVEPWDMEHPMVSSFIATTGMELVQSTTLDSGELSYAFTFDPSL